MIIKAPIDLDLTQLSGQTSQPPWIFDGNSYREVVRVNDEVVLFDVAQSGDYIDFNFEGNVKESDAVSRLKYIYDLDFDLDKFYRYLSNYDELCEMSEFCNGLRLFLAKDPFECIISSICSANNSIKRWTKSMSDMKSKWGTNYFNDFYTFPDKSVVRNLYEDDEEELLICGKCQGDNLKECGVGYRAPYMKKASEMFTLEMDLSEIPKMSYDEAFETILKVPGVGPKVADCILLYGFNFKEAFPSDVWIKRIVSYLYFDGKDISVPKVREFGMEEFGDYAGYVQLYMFHYGPKVETAVVTAPKAARYEGHLVAEKFIDAKEDDQGRLTAISFPNRETFNFGFDIVDEIARQYPDKLAMLYVDKHHEERRFTFKDIKDASNQCANYFTSLGIRRGDRVMLVLKRHYQFWFCMVALHKLGAIAIPATNQLKQHDFEYRFNAAGVKALICTADGDTAEIAERAAAGCPSVETLILVNGTREGWHSLNDEYPLFTRRYHRPEDASCGDEPALMFFTSGTTGNPKMAQHKHTYALGHYVTAKYWHCCERDGLHFTISDTGWGKSLWGKLYGQWLCEGAVFVYDFDRFDAADILPMFKKYNITTFCAPPTMLRMFIRVDLANYDLSSIHHMTTAGEALNPEVFRQFEKATGLQIMEGFGQTETTLTIGNLFGGVPKIGSMGKANPQYDVDIVDPDGNPVANGEVGEIVIHTDKSIPCGLFREYYLDGEKTQDAWHDGLYHTGDTAWRDEDGYFWYVSRIDDVIKSSGYRIGPFEIESVIMELPYVLECGVSAEPDEIRGQIVKASIVLTKGTEGTEELKKEIQQYVKEHTAPYKYPRKIVFRDELPKTISGKIQRNLL